MIKKRFEMSNIVLLKSSKLVAEVLKTRYAMGKRLGVYLLKKFLGVLFIGPVEFFEVLHKNKKKLS